jgi:hypothetical protein
MQEINATTAGHLLGMNETELVGTGARRRGAFDLGGNQEASRMRRLAADATTTTKPAPRTKFKKTHKSVIIYAKTSELGSK